MRPLPWNDLKPRPTRVSWFLTRPRTCSTRPCTCPIFAKDPKDRPPICFQRSVRIGATVGARKDLPKTHRSRSQQETSRRQSRTTANDGRAASRVLGRSAWLGGGVRFSSLEPISTLLSARVGAVAPSRVSQRQLHCDDRRIENRWKCNSRRMRRRVLTAARTAWLSIPSPLSAKIANSEDI